MALLPVNRPFPWQTMLDYLTVRCTPCLESVEGSVYRRHGLSAVSLEAGGLLVDGDPGPVARMFDIECPVDDVKRVLQRCPVLKPRLRALPGVRVPGCWSPFELTVRAILGQQVSVRGAHTLMRRLNERCPDFTPAQVAECDLRGVGLTNSRAATIRGVAEKDIDFTREWAEVAAHLLSVRGIGPWTVSYLGMRVGRDPDSFPQTDLGLLHAFGTKDPKELLRAAERWRPFRAYAAMLLWMTPQEADIR
ncbi:AlkA N-terminal domain-containing protein [uncultured Paludibaculum sp.]|uniref:DNA-3-methyladenine glycosylase family protein n=1 Tax=uncultured Paludibaculum sp. TaxID=1765020 RepID=UPI002AAAABA2|nr:AlkA N-terminal domain-containing protein [uncultured Paludibaculum sp.]